MIFSRAVALSVLATLGVQGLLIPSNADVIDVFGKSNKEVAKPIEDKTKAKSEGLISKIGEVAKKLKVELIEDVSKLAPIFTVKDANKLIPHKYIIVFKEGMSRDEMQFHQEWIATEYINSLAALPSDDSFLMTVNSLNIAGGISDAFHISENFAGYTGYFTDGIVELIRRSPAVRYVEQDSVVNASEFDVEVGAPWGLARVSHRQPLSLNSFNQYLYDTDGGSGVTAYVIDTGVYVNHKELEGRAVWGATIPSGDEDVDGNGHGTHCAGTIASKQYGVAKNAKVVAVKVLRSNGSGSMSDVVKGVEFAAKAHVAEATKKEKGFKGSTANMSLGGGKSPALDQAVDAAVTLGLHFAVAAGNENQDACNTSPASSEKAITVGASTISDSRAYFSNYGKCVDIFAPGMNILSTYIGSESATATLSGTSMASPHICGLLSYLLSLQPSADSEFAMPVDAITPEQMKKKLIAYGTMDMLTDIPEETPNILAFNGAGHNLTDFWSLDALQESGKERLSENIETKLEELWNGKSPESIVDGVKKLVDSIVGSA